MPNKVHILRLSSVGSKFSKFLMSFFNAPVSSSSNFATFFTVMTHNSYVLFFGSNIIFFRQKQHIKVHVSRLATARIKINQISGVIFGTKSQFFLKLCITLQWHEIQLFWTFSSKNVYSFDKRSPSKCKFLDFWLLTWQLTKFLMSFFKPPVSFALNFASLFSVLRNNLSVLV